MGTSTPAFLGYTIKAPDGQLTGKPVLVRGRQEFVDLFWVPYGLAEARERQKSLQADLERLSAEIYHLYVQLDELLPEKDNDELYTIKRESWQGPLPPEREVTLKKLEKNIPQEARELYAQWDSTGRRGTAYGEEADSLQANIKKLEAAEKWRLIDAVSGFFANGGTSCYIVRLDHTEPLFTVLPGDVDDRTGLDGLRTVPEVSMVAVPDLWPASPGETYGAQCMQLVVAHCVTMRNRLAVLDAPRDTGVAELKGFLTFLTTSDPDAAFTTLYYPWISVPAPGGGLRDAPPCGHVAGVWARTDAERGVFKAPANEVLRDVAGLTTALTDTLQGELNDKGVNCLRTLPGQGHVVWGARTRSTSRDWVYVNVRRLVCFLAESIRLSSTWAVFEPNDDRLWASLRNSVTSFLTDQWRQGALLGRTPEEAFYVVCDRTNNIASTIDAGKVICDIGVAPVRPAEFVHFQITQIAGQPAKTG
ncbi:phage tail sheath C-terminal domain-containing protein [Streptomyces cinnamoneus]|uniref:phage tail sheath C-terminal domain-containing protein n=1 Tax=Streptomyces cinnamoneus TaxID=53446 RepID=UPI00340BC438